MIRYLELNFDSEFYGYINGDIIQSSYIYDVLFQLHTLREQKKIPSHVCCELDYLSVVGFCGRTTDQLVLRDIFLDQKLLGVLWYHHSIFGCRWRTESTRRHCMQTALSISCRITLLRPKGSWPLRTWIPLWLAVDMWTTIWCPLLVTRPKMRLVSMLLMEVCFLFFLDG